MKAAMEKARNFKVDPQQEDDKTLKLFEDKYLRSLVTAPMEEAALSSLLDDLFTYDTTKQLARDMLANAIAQEDVEMDGSPSELVDWLQYAHDAIVSSLNCVFYKHPLTVPICRCPRRNLLWRVSEALNAASRFVVGHL
jgi:hypothetical protein